MRYGGHFRDADVEGVKAVWRLTPYLLLTVPYWAVYTQMSTAFQNQVPPHTCSLHEPPIPRYSLSHGRSDAFFLGLSPSCLNPPPPLCICPRVQGCQMDLRLGESVTIAVSTLNLFDTLAILLLIPVFDKLVYPFFKRRGTTHSPGLVNIGPQTGS